MNQTSKILVALLLATPALALAAATATARVQNGDATRGAALFHLNCATCHGRDGRGDGPLAKALGAPAPADLRDVAFLMQRSDDDLQHAVAQGGRAVKKSFTMPAFGAQLPSLDIWDMVAFVRLGQPSVAEFFSSAGRYTAKTYALDADAQRRLDPLLGKLASDEQQVVLAAAFSGEKVEGEEPAFVPQDPRMLDALKPKQKLGYLAFVYVAVPGIGSVPVSLAMDREGIILAVKPRMESVADKDRASVEKLLAGYEGAGGKHTPYEALTPPRPAKDKDPKKAAKAAKDKKEKKDDPKDAQEMAKALTRAYLRAVEGAAAFDKEERDRHWAD